MSGQIQNNPYHPIGKPYVGMTKESIRADIDAMNFKSEKEREKAYNKQIELFNHTNTLVPEEVDDFISEKEIEAYNREEQKKNWKKIGFAVLNICIASVLGKGLGKGLYSVEKLRGANLVKKQIAENAGKIKQPKSALQILEGFKPVESLDEAKRRALNEYGIKNFKVTDLGCANDALYTLELIKTKSTQPIGITKIIETNSLRNNVAGTMNPYTGKMRISKDCLVLNFLRRLSMAITQLPPDKSFEYIELLTKINGKEGMPLFRLTQDFIKFGIKPQSLDDLPFNTLLHEHGHRAHYLAVGNKKLYWKMGKLNEIKEAGIKDFSIYNEFMSDKIQNVIKSCPFLGDYARTSPCEFVAEVYSALINDIKLPENIMELYKKYHGPVVLQCL